MRVRPGRGHLWVPHRHRYAMSLLACVAYQAEGAGGRLLAEMARSFSSTAHVGYCPWFEDSSA
eukprot:3561071-Amphidinium_carterae.1